MTITLFQAYGQRFFNGFNKRVFQQPANPFGSEQGWFSDETDSFLGVIIQDKFDEDWGYVVLGRDEYFEFRAIKWEINLPKREDAVFSLQMKIAELLSHPQRIFPQG